MEQTTRTDFIKSDRIEDKRMFQQNKFASMGEMIANISHQWRQPLMELSSLFIHIEAQIKLTGTVSNQEVLETIKKSNDITKYMSHTIDDFQNFFSKEKNKVNFKISDQLNSSINIISSGLKKNNINLNIIIKRNSVIKGFKNEYSQVVINIINNAKDMFVQRKIKNPKIEIYIEEDENNSILRILDNAGGIKTEPLSKIFEPFFTYEKANGTGIGLFMSKLIIENNMEGKLTVENKADGAEFKISVPKEK